MSLEFRLSTLLAAEAAETSGRPKRARTKAALLAATARELERVGYVALTVDDVVRAARMARGTFYLYFDNKTEAAIAVFDRFTESLRRLLPRGGEQTTAYRSILRTNRYYVRTYALNAGLLAGLESLLFERPDMAAKRDALNQRWSLTVLRDLERRLGPAAREVPRELKLMAIRAAAAMVDELLREIYVHRSPRLVAMAGDDDQVAELISLIWHRSLFGADPPDEELDWVRPLVKLTFLAAANARPMAVPDVESG